MDTYGHIMDKAQKLTAALYRVTDLLSDREPLKWVLRKRAVNIYNNLLIIKNNGKILNAVLENLSCLAKNLELVSLGTYISNLNFEILKKEYNNLKSLIEGENLSDISIGHLIGHKSIPKGSPLVPQVPQGEPLGNSDRKQKIIEFLKNQGPKTISEIAPILEGIGEKSLQRDLFDLVQAGQLRADGEKRWRKYSFLKLES